MIIVTGGAGFIGSNLVKALNDRGRNDIIVVDDMTDGKKFVNLADCKICDYIDYEDFINHQIHTGGFAKADVIFHQGACSNTTEWNGRLMMKMNFDYSRKLFAYCSNRSIPFIYASSAAVYGGGKVFRESAQQENPLNVYGYSKLLFDQCVRMRLPQIHTQVAGLRYFNVYGPREQHKGDMASVVFHLNRQLKESGRMQLFAGCDGYGDGEQRRDFIYVDDVVKVNLWMWEHPKVSGIFNVGTGRSQTFNEVAAAVRGCYDRGEIEYIPFPESLKGSYQSFTEADISDLHELGYDSDFMTVEQAVPLYLEILEGGHETA